MGAFDDLFSDDVRSFVPSPVRAIFKNYDFTDMISFAGGYPSSDTFPVKDISDAVSSVFDKYGPSLLQYGATEGAPVLRKALSERYGVEVGNIQITTSSQQGIDLCTRVFVNPGDTVLTSEPTFLGALQSFYSYQAKVKGVPYSENADELAANYRKAIDGVILSGSRPKFIYVIPDFNNPTGETLSFDARGAILDVAGQFNIPVVEDSPYRELRYEGEDIPSMYSMAPDMVLHLGSFSKILAPGFRLGWIFGPEELLSRITACKQSVDLCPPMLDQYVAAELLENGVLQRNLVRSVSMYRRKRDVMLDSLQKYMPEGVKWSRPQGGLFLFLHLPEGIDTVSSYDYFLSRKLAYVSGAFFHTDGSGRDTIRLNFSFMSEEKIVEGIERLASILRSSY